jgi:hypothetical protein
MLKYEKCDLFLKTKSHFLILSYFKKVAMVITVQSHEPLQ